MGIVWIFIFLYLKEQAPEVKCLYSIWQWSPLKEVCTLGLLIQHGNEHLWSEERFDNVSYHMLYLLLHYLSISLFQRMRDRA